MRTIRNMIYLLDSLYSTTLFLLSEKSLYNEEFREKFKDKEDKKLLDDTVDELIKINDGEPRTIKLKNETEVTIVVG